MKIILGFILSIILISLSYSSRLDNFFMKTESSKELVVRKDLFYLFNSIKILTANV